MVKMLKLPDGQGGLADLAENDPALRDMQKMSSSELRDFAQSMRDADYSFDDGPNSSGSRGRAARALWGAAAAVDVANAVSKSRLVPGLPGTVAGAFVPVPSMHRDAGVAISLGRERVKALGILADTMAAARERAEQSPGYTPRGPMSGSTANYGSTHFSDSRDDTASPSYIPTNLLRLQRAMPESPVAPLPEPLRAMPEPALPPEAPQENAVPATGDRNEDEFGPSSVSVARRPYDKMSAVDLMRALR